MRLTDTQRNIITELVYKYFGNSSHALLFGSRACNEALGGDVDLLICVDHKSDGLYQKKLAFLAELKMRMGDQRIDLIIAEKDSSSAFIDEVTSTGVAI